MKRRSIVHVLCATAAGSLAIAGTVSSAQAAPAAASTRPVVVVNGLNNPRQLSLVHGDVLLVAEAGKGGTVATVTGPDGSELGLGYTGSVSAVLSPQYARGQRPHRIISGLLSGAAAASTPDGGPKGGGATGPDGVTARSLNDIAVLETTFEPATPKKAKPFDGQLLRAHANGPVRPFADITGFEAKHDPDGHGVDSDPYYVINYGDGWLASDAAGNDVLRVSRSGRISVFHVFPNVTTGACAGQFDPTPAFPGCNFVPTAMVADSWGNVYVGGLSSLTPGEAQVVKLDRWGHVLRTWTGFTAVNGLALGPDSSLYVSQLFADEAHPALPIIQGVLTKVRGNSRTNVDVPFPAGVAVDRRGNVFVSAFSILPSTGAGIPGVDTSGQVWRLRF